MDALSNWELFLSISALFWCVSKSLEQGGGIKTSGNILLKTTHPPIERFNSP